MKTLSIIALIAAALAQLFVPAKMIMHYESILKHGKEFHFKTAPIDPSDPFRGKYIILNFDEIKFTVSSDTFWQYNQTIYVTLENDSSGFAKITSVEKEIPAPDTDFVKAKVSYSSSEDEVYFVVIEYPFQTFYMEESKASAAETVYREAAIDSNQVAYAVVNILNGEAVVSDVMIDGKSIAELVSASQEIK